VAAKLLVGNWKMNGRAGDARGCVTALASELGMESGVATVICPPFPLLPEAAAAAEGTAVGVGAQDCHHAASGAHTGDVAAPLLADAGCGHVIVGHSERRADHGETDDTVRAKAQAAAAAGLAPVVCVGETAAERGRAETEAVLVRQIERGLPAALPHGGAVAYEPVWAIGTGVTPDAEAIASAMRTVDRCVRERLGEAGAECVRLLYGGSVKPANAGELWPIDGVDGFLVGGASLKPDSMLAIARAAP